MKFWNRHITKFFEHKPKKPTDDLLQEVQRRQRRVEMELQTVQAVLQRKGRK